MRLPQDERDGALPLDRAIRVLVEHGVEVRKEAHRYRLRRDDVLEWQFFCDPVPRYIIQTLSRKFEIDIVEFYYFGNTERNRREPDVPI
jgi:hypothetical protein